MVDCNDYHVLAGELMAALELFANRSSDRKERARSGYVSEDYDYRVNAARADVVQKLNDYIDARIERALKEQADAE